MTPELISSRSGRQGVSNINSRWAVELSRRVSAPALASSWLLHGVGARHPIVDSTIGRPVWSPPMNPRSNSLTGLMIRGHRGVGSITSENSIQPHPLARLGGFNEWSPLPSGLSGDAMASLLPQGFHSTEVKQQSLKQWKQALPSSGPRSAVSSVSLPFLSRVSQGVEAEAGVESGSGYGTSEAEAVSSGLSYSYFT